MEHKELTEDQRKDAFKFTVGFQIFTSRLAELIWNTYGVSCPEGRRAEKLHQVSQELWFAVREEAVYRGGSGYADGVVERCKVFTTEHYTETEEFKISWKFPFVYENVGRNSRPKRLSFEAHGALGLEFHKQRGGLHQIELEYCQLRPNEDVKRIRKGVSKALKLSGEVRTRLDERVCNEHPKTGSQNPVEAYYGLGTY